ncbi:MAG TPA: hypothetical protein VHF26_09450, partial [Trebonia sp.]|nr:hypothetical protein [Trebonia sp.]
MTDSARFSWTVLLPVKVLDRAKSRLAGLAGDRRRDLALALAADTVAAVLACPEVTGAVVVTSDPVAGSLLAALGALVVPDEPGEPAGRPPRLAASTRANGADGANGEPPGERLGGPFGEPGGQQSPLAAGEQGLLNAALRH